MVKRKKSAFGEFLVQEIKNAEMSQESFYKAVGIAKPYFYDILTAAPPPADIQRKMVEVLNNKTGINQVRTRKLYDLAAQERNELSVDISRSLMRNPEGWDNVREMLKMLESV